MNYLFNDRNLVRSAVLTALNVNPSAAIYRTDTAAKAGGGSVTVTGPYTGNHDTTIDVEILDATGDSSQVSEPVFSGVGNGTMTDAAVTALDPQDITVTLVDLGTPTLAAQAPFQGATLVAKTTGPSGNDILVSIDANGITRSDPFASTQHSISAGTNQFTGSEWNFGALALINGKLDPATPRICFGEDPQVYRPYKVYDAGQGQYVYSFSPAPVRDVPAFASVRNVTGTWTVHITNGVSSEDFTGIVTLYDALSAVQAGSDLVSVQGVVVNDLTPNGQGANDLSVWTDSYVLSVVGTGSEFVTRNDLQVSVASSAPTETLRVKCIDASVAGVERWDVAGDISGDLGIAISGEAFTAGAYGLTIPLQLPSSTPPGGNITAVFQPIPRSEGVKTPVMCLEQGVLGARATSGQFTFVWKKRPAPDCDCSTGDLIGGPDVDCLGIQPGGGGMSSTVNSVIVRQQQLAAAVRQYVNANTDPSSLVAVNDVPWIEEWGNILGAGLTTAASGPLIDLPVWQADHVYGRDEFVQPVLKTGYRFVASITSGALTGTSGSSEPTWPATLGDTVIDGEITWTNTGKTAFAMWDDFFASGQTEMELLSGVGAAWNVPTWAHATYVSDYFKVSVPGGSLVGVRPTTSNGFIYLGSITGDAFTATTGTVEPTWPTVLNGTVADGDFIWKAYSQYWAATTSYALDVVINPGIGQGWKVTTTGTSGASEPDWTQAGPITDGSVVWTRQSAFDLPNSANTSREIYMERFHTQMTEVAAAAGIGPNFKGASANGDGCWQDRGGQFWFESQDGLLPLFPGYGYHSAKMVLDENGKPFAQSTEQFYVGIRWGCPEALAIGDTLVIDLENVSGGPTTYQQGDEWDIAVSHGEPLQLGGGQDGDDTLTWSVVSSIGTAFASYALITTALAPYDDSGLTFQITPGGIAFALGDTFRLSVEGGHFQWRRDGGSWSSSTVIGDTDAGDGLTIVFAGGAAPSWVADDTWSFAAEATNGPDRAKSPTDGRFGWSTSTTLTIEPDAPGPVTRFAIFDHHIPSDATITLQGSDDGFGTTPTSIVIPWTAGNLFATIASVTRAAWRLVIDRPGDFFWAFLGQPMQPSFTNHVTGQTGPDIGHFTRRRRAAGNGVRAGIGGDVVHDVVSADSMADFETGFDYACGNDDGAFGLVINDTSGETSLVRFAGTDIETKDQVFDYQAPRTARYQTFTVPVEALP